MSYYSDIDAANGMREAFTVLERIEKDKGRYEWSLPDHVQMEQHAAAGRVGDAVRYFMEADDDEATS